ncbi:MAG: hypothetical protein WCJ84_04445 [Candidatus Peregrinibacteria bacterium]
MIFLFPFFRQSSSFSLFTEERKCWNTPEVGNVFNKNAPNIGNSAVVIQDKLNVKTDESATGEAITAQSEVPATRKADLIAQGKDFQALVRSGVTFYLDAKGKLKIVDQVSIKNIPAGTPPENPIKNLQPLLDSIDDLRVHRILLMKSTQPDARMVYLKTFRDVNGPITPEVIQRRNLSYSFNPAADPSWKELLEKTPLGQIIANESQGNIYAVDDWTLRPLNAEFEQKTLNTASRREALRTSVNKGAPTDIEDLPPTMQIAGAVALLMLFANSSKTTKNVLSGLVLANIGAKMTTGSSLIDMAQSLGTDIMNETDIKVLQTKTAKELQAVYTTMNPLEQKQVLALTPILDRKTPDITNHIDKIVNTGGGNMDFELLKHAQTSSLWDEELKVLEGEGEREMVTNLKIKGVKALDLNNGLFECLSFLGNGVPSEGYKILKASKDMTLAELLWAKTQERINHDSASVTEKAAGMAVTTVEFAKTVKAEVMNTKYAQHFKDIKEWGGKVIVTMTKFTAGVAKDVIFDVDPKTGKWSFNPLPNSTLTLDPGLKNWVFDNAQSAMEAVGVGTFIDLDKDIPYTEAQKMEKTKPGDPKIPYNTVTLENGDIKYVYKEAFPTIIQEKIETMKYDKDFYQTMVSMAEMVEKIDENHPVGLRSMITQESVIKWATTGDSGSVKENTWIQLFQVKGRELLMIYGKMLKNKGTKSDNAITEDFKKNYLTPFKEQFENIRDHVRKEGGLATEWYRWLANPWDSGFGSLNEENANDILRRMTRMKSSDEWYNSVKDIFTYTEGEGSTPLVVQSENIATDEEKKLLSQKASNTMLQIYQGSEWEDVIGRNFTEDGTKVRSYAVSQYLRLLATIDSSNSATISHDNYLDALHYQFMKISDYAQKGVITKEKVDHLFLDTKTWDEYKQNAIPTLDSIRRGVTAVSDGANEAVKTNIDIPTKIAGIIKSLGNNYTGKIFAPADTQKELNTLTNNIVMQTKALDPTLTNLPAIEAYMQTQGKFFRVDVMPVAGGNHQIIVELSNLESAGEIVPDPYFPSATGDIKTGIDGVKKQKVLTLTEDYINQTIPGKMGGSQDQNSILLYKKNIEDIVKGQFPATTTNPALKAAKEARFMKLVESNEMGHSFFKSIFDKAVEPDCLSKEYAQKATFTYEGKTWTLHQLNEAFSDVTSTKEAFLHGDFADEFTNRLKAPSIQQYDFCKHFLTKFLGAQKTADGKGAMSNEDYLKSIDAPVGNASQKAIMDAMEKEIFILINNQIITLNVAKAVAPPAPPPVPGKLPIINTTPPGP